MLGTRLSKSYWTLGKCRAHADDAAEYLTGLSDLLDGITAPFEARRTRPLVRCRTRLLLLRGGLLLRSVLAPALAARGHRTRRRASTGVVTDDFADDRTARCAARAGTRRSAGRRNGRLRSRRWRIGGIVLALLHGPSVALAFVLLLLLLRLALGRVDE